MKNRYLVSCALAIALLSGSGRQSPYADDRSCGGARPKRLRRNRRPPMSPKTTRGARSARSWSPLSVATRAFRTCRLTVQAFHRSNTLSSLNVTDFTGTAPKLTPNVTYGTNGPGQGTVFIRGLSGGAAGNQSSATVGNFPNVAIYLDDQSMQFPGRNVDIYVADMARIEVLGRVRRAPCSAAAPRRARSSLHHQQAQAEHLRGQRRGPCTASPSMAATTPRSRRC